MSILKKLFSKSDEFQENFSEGDLFYTFFDNHYHFYKLLKEDIDLDIYHVLIYKPVAELPDKYKLSELDILAYHSPIAKTGFKGAKLFSNSILIDDDFIGYHEYLRQTQNIKELVSIASNYYKEAYHLTDLKQHEKAIEKYSRAIELIPAFFEAIDNRAFCKMDLGKWNEAIEDFRLSLTVNPNSLLAEFSIGECFFKMKDYKNAIKQFEKAIDIDPTDLTAKDFLKKAIELDR